MADVSTLAVIAASGAVAVVNSAISRGPDRIREGGKSGSARRAALRRALFTALLLLGLWMIACEFASVAA
jgi:hypothetical protein